MADHLQRLEDWVAPLLDRMSPAERRGLARAVARDLRAANVDTMRAQTAPDGSAWEPRKNKLRDERGRIRQKAKAQDMFVRLRAAKHLKAQATPSEAMVAFAGRSERIARVHQFGLEDRVKPGGPTYHYPVRELLGITDAPVERVRELVLSHLSGKD